VQPLRSARVSVTSILITALTACGGASIPPSGSSLASASATGDAQSGHFRLLHAFGNSPDGTNPFGGLTQLDGSLYGGTESGGAYGDGAIYSLSITGKEKIIHSFDGSDGWGTYAELLAYNGVLYGAGGVGVNFYGSVFSITPSGSFTVLHKFAGVDGINPSAGLIAVNGMLYGTTYQGGADGVGVVYAIDPSGNERVVYSFGSYSNDGTYPAGTLVFWKHKLYGTTNGGGTSNDGTVFSLTTSGNETVLHNFGSGSDGKAPYASNLAPLDGSLYGTTGSGGTHARGIVFQVLPSGTVRTVYNFGDQKTDGGWPYAGVIAYRNALYGTTDGGGAGGQGTIFRITTNGNERVVYAFSGDDGSSSYSRLLPEGTNMYGTTFNGGQYGGTGFQGGTAFRFTP
jgi:uncharacterized repeat protein (TIGR03803 family)